jgi:hypothetical protein
LPAELSNGAKSYKELKTALAACPAGH